MIVWILISIINLVLPWTDGSSFSLGMKILAFVAAVSSIIVAVIILMKTKDKREK